MKEQSSVPGNQIDLMFKAFSDKTRLRILSLLQGGECCVGDLVEILQVEQPSASRHLAYLRRAGLVAVRKTRQWSYYSLALARGAFHEKLLECLSCCFQEVPQIRADRARATKLKGFCCPDTEMPREQKHPKKVGKHGTCCPDDEE
jgi:ArsR family transcriptional regulator, arsenate/arsenite/antimonite-responsive transcriptional repressor